MPPCHRATNARLKCVKYRAVGAVRADRLLLGCEFIMVAFRSAKAASRNALLREQKATINCIFRINSQPIRDNLLIYGVGSVVMQDGWAWGSSLIGPSFDEPNYFWGRPSATGPVGYNAAASSGSDLGPTSKIREVDLIHISARQPQNFELRDSQKFEA